jgi:protein-S-isoprenylcysteine O-methyltransferase Ste14
MIDRSIRSKLAHARYVYYLALGLGLLVLSSFVSPALAQTEIAGRLNEPNVSARKIFIMLFLMLGPIKILVPFVNLTRNADPVLRRRLATRAILFSMGRWHWLACWAGTSWKISKFRSRSWP